MNPNEPILVLIQWLQRIIPIAAIIPIAQYLLGMIREDEQATMYRRRIRNVIVYVLIAELAMGFIRVLENYIYL